MSNVSMGGFMEFLPGLLLASSRDVWGLLDCGIMAEQMVCLLSP